MATYYVRKSGNDGNGGLSPTDAWLTIDNAANNVAAGDVVYIGSGRYEEFVTMDTSGANGNIISYIGDIDGLYTGDPGPVLITAYDNPTSGSTRARTIDLNGKLFITFQYLMIIGGSTVAIGDTSGGNLSLEQIVFDSCYICRGDHEGVNAIHFDLNAVVAPGTTGFRIQKCVILGNMYIQWDQNAVANVVVNWRIQNNLALGFDNTAGGGRWINFAASVGGNFGMTDIVIAHNTGWGHESFVVSNWMKDAVTPSLSVLNNVAQCDILVNDLGGGAANGVYEDYNYNYGGNTKGGAGAGTIQSGGNSKEYDEFEQVLFGGMADVMFRRMIGWSPWKPWEPVVFQDQSVYAPDVVDRDSTPGLTEDIYGSPRPMLRNVDDVGAVEARARGLQETTTTRSGSNSMRFEGAGFHDIMIPVNVKKTTITVYGRFDANYTGAKPRLRVYGIPGVADQADTMTGAAGAWEELSVEFTPYQPGFVRVRLESQDTSATGECYFDDLEVRP